MQIPNISKIQSKFFENNASFSCRECQTLSSGMRIIILLLIMEEQAFLCKCVIFRKLKNIYIYLENIASFSCRGW